MNSGGIGLLVTLLVRAQRAGGRLVATGLSDHYRQIFELTRLDEAIQIDDDEDAAVLPPAPDRHARETEETDMIETKEPAKSTDAASTQRSERELGPAGRPPLGRRGGRRRGRRGDRQAGGRPAPGVRPAVAEVVLGPSRRRRHHPGIGHRDVEGAFPEFWPKGQRFYAPLSGIKPGEVALLEIQPLPGAPIKLSTGVLVLYADDESFTFMTPEGHTLSAWITFSARRDGDVMVAQAEALERPSDPFDEMAYMLVGSRQNNKFWEATLRQPRGARRRQRRRPSRRSRVHRQEPAVALLAERPQQRHPPIGSAHHHGTGPQADRPGVRPHPGIVPGDSAAPVDAIVVGAGPNGLAAAITLARAGRSVRVYEAAATAGGGTRTAELTLPGFRHDVCSTILPLTIASPFFATIDLAARGRRAHPPGRALRAPVRWRPRRGPGAVVRATADGLGGADGRAWRRLFGPLVRDVGKLGPGDPAAGRPRAATPVGARAVRAARAPVGAGPGARPVRR